MNIEVGSKEERILLAAIDCIDRYGIVGATTRRISEAANVNIAAVNYYFRSKDRLIDAAMTQTMENSFGDWEELIARSDISLEERLRTMLQELFAGSRRYPGLTRAHLYGAIAEGDYTTEAALRYRHMSNSLASVFVASLPGVDFPTAHRRAVGLLSAATLPAVSPGLFYSPDGEEPDEKTVASYIDDIIRSALASG